jgi:hypothetical protein
LEFLFALTFGAAALTMKTGVKVKCSIHDTNSRQKILIDTTAVDSVTIKLNE